MIFLSIDRVRNTMVLGLVVLISACQKMGTIPVVPSAASLTVVNAVPGSTPVIPVINTGSPITYFSFVNPLIGYGSFIEYSPPGGEDTTYVVQRTDTLALDIGPKSNMLFYNILNLKPGGIYSLYLCGTDTSSPDYLLTTDSIPYYGPTDSVMGIRFVNLSTGSNPISINLEGNANGSEIGSLAYKGITTFKQYVNNSNTLDYFFVIRDAATGDSLTQFDFVQNYSYNGGFGLIDPVTYNLLTFKSITIAIYGSESNGSTFPLNTMLVDDY
jgi:hypothetical protein